MTEQSLADFVIESGQYATGEAKEGIRVIGRELIANPRRGRAGIKRFVYDDKVQNILTRMSELPFEDFIGQFNHIILPVDEFWIESSHDNKKEPRFGFHIKKDGGIIRARHVVEAQLPTKEEFRDESHCGPIPPEQRRVIESYDPERFAEEKGLHLVNNRYVIATNVEIIFSEKGVSLSDEKTAYNTSIRATEEDKAKGRENHVITGQYIYKLLVLVSSRNVITNFVEGPATAPNSETAPGSLHPIRIDLSPSLEQALIRKDKKGIKELLGWTDVIRHRRTYHTLAGPVVKIIEPHDRRIPAPIDRRGVTRVFTASDQNLANNFTPKRPLFSPKEEKEQEPSGQ